MFQSAMDDDVYGDINRNVFFYVQDELDRKVNTPHASSEIDIWLDSPGGSASIAFKLLLELRSRFNKIRVVIPDYAKSAATLLAIGADEIYMAAAAELGPLDAQVEHPNREGVSVSALDVAKGYDFLGKFAAAYTISGGGQVFKWIKLPRTDVLHEFLRFAAAFLEPAVEKLDPHLIHRATNQLDLAHKYAENVLKRRNPTESTKSEGGQEKFDIKRFADHLVRDYPAHEFVISRDEATALNLPIKNAEEYDLWKHAVKFHKFVRKRNWGRNLGSLIDVLNQQDFKERFSDDKDEPKDGTKNAEGTEAQSEPKEGE
jgi:hypothetical protein